MEELEVLFGMHIPDVEFVIATSDRPMVMISKPDTAAAADASVAAQPPVEYPPVIRFCTSEGHADISAPIFHFYSECRTPRCISYICTGEKLEVST